MNKGIAENSIILKFNNGNTSGITFSSLDKITFSGSNMIVSQKNNSSNAYSLLIVQNLIFGLYADTPTVYPNNNLLNFYPNPAQDYIKINNTDNQKTHIEIFSTDGTLKLSTVVESSSTPINIKFLQPGMYIIKANNTSSKLMKK